MAAISSLTIRWGVGTDPTWVLRSVNTDGGAREISRIREAAGTSERKTGLYVPNVETTRLVRDERGWLRLAR